MPLVFRHHNVFPALAARIVYLQHAMDGGQAQNIVTYTFNYPVLFLGLYGTYQNFGSS